MILESLKYVRSNCGQTAWILSGKDSQPVFFGNTNLIVGKNGSGKSRSLSIISDMANLLALKKTTCQLAHSDWECDLTFKEGPDTYIYHLTVRDKIITEEVITINSKEKFDRKKGVIFSEETNKLEEISISSDREVVVSLHTQVNKYPYLGELFEWGSALKRFTFTNQSDKDHLLKRNELEDTSKAKIENTAQLFYRGERLFPNDFVDAIKTDMKRLDYSTNHISIEESEEGVGISVQEDELLEATLQTDMSQGMFRALSFIINLNYALFSKASVCLLIDDLGEGLDFSRSKSLIDLLTHKINDSEIQVFITTNDRYVMNTIPLKYWSVLDRSTRSSTFYNYFNSQDVFEDFKFTGLNNFDFLATDFYLHGFGSDEEEEES